MIIPDSDGLWVYHCINAAFGAAVKATKKRAKIISLGSSPF